MADDAGDVAAIADSLGRALEGEQRLAVELQRQDTELRQQVAADPATMLGNVELSDSDKEVLSRADFAQITREVVSEETRHRVWGWVDDDLAFVPLGIRSSRDRRPDPGLVRDTGRPGSGAPR